MIRRRYLTNVFSNWVQMACAIGWGIVMMPVYLGYLGKADYGIWVLIHALVGYYGLLDLGVHNAVIRHVARYLGSGDSKSLNQVFNTALVIQGLAGLLALAVCVFVASILPRVEGFAAAQHPGIGTLLLLVGVRSALEFPGSVFRGALVAAERFELANAVRIVSLSLINSAHIVVLYRGGGLVELAWVLLIATVIVKPVTAVLALRTVPGLRLAPRSFRRSRVREVLGYGLHAFVSNAGERLRFFTDALVIGTFLPAQAITDFRVGSRPLQFLTNFVRGISRVLTPAFSRTESAGEVDAIGRLLLFGTRATALLASLGCLVLAVAGERLIDLWLGPGFDLSIRILLVLMPAYLLETSLAPTGSALLGTRHFRVLSRATIAEGLANLILSLVLIRPFGLIGVALGTTIPMVVTRLFVLPWFACRGAGLNYTRLMRETWAPVALPLVGTALLSALLVRWLPGRDWLSVAALVVVVTASYAGLAIVSLRARRDPLLPARLQVRRSDR